MPHAERFPNLGGPAMDMLSIARLIAVLVVVLGIGFYILKPEK
jgi:hypothetical protein